MNTSEAVQEILKTVDYDMLLVTMVYHSMGLSYYHSVVTKVNNQLVAYSLFKPTQFLLTRCNWQNTMPNIELAQLLFEHEDLFGELLEYVTVQEYGYS